MKKLIYTIGMLMFLSGPFHPWNSLAAEENPQEQSCNVIEDPNCRVTGRIEYALRGQGNKGLDWGNGFGSTDPAEVGQNLYLLIYSKTEANTLGDAIKATAAQYGLPPERMSLILGGDITPIMEKSPLMSIDKAVSIYNQMVQTYNDKKNSLDVAAVVDAQIQPNELFQDGDTGNSGFDLVNDLNNIEIILFQKNDQVTFGQPYEGSDDGEEETASSSSTSTPGPGEIPVDVSGASSTSGGTGSGGTAGGSAGGKKPACSTFEKVEDKSAAFLGGINPNQCFATKGLEKALSDFDKKAQAGELPCQPETTTKSAEGNTGAGGGSGGGAGAGPDVAFPTSTTTAPPKTPTPAAPPSDYSKPSLCGEIICISIDFITKPATPSTGGSDNCIKCHVEYINASLQKTLSHSLIPAKATGNLGESGLCKNAMGTALGSVGMNVSLSLVPVVTPAKDDLMTVGNITDEWDKFAQQNGAWNYGEKQRRQLQSRQTGTVDTSPVMSSLDRSVMLEASIVSDTTTQADLFGKADKQVVTEQATEKQQMLTASVAKAAFGQVDTMKALDDEMKAMNNYFLTFQKLFRTLTEKVPGLSSSEACNKLNQKQVCS